MTDKHRPGMGFEVNIRKSDSSQSASRKQDNTPFCMAVLGDFSGLSTDQRAANLPLSKRKPVLIDRDNFEEVLAKLHPSFDIHFSADGSSAMTIDIAELDDFHPDTLYEKLDIFSKLRSIRRRLKNKDTFDSAANEIMGWLVPEQAPESSAAHTKEQAPPQQTEVPTDNLLDSILTTADQPGSDLEKLTSASGIDQLVKQIIAPYVEPSTNPRQGEMLDAVDTATAAHMRRILHHPVFQSMEAAWRSMYFLVSRIETSRQLKIYLLDVSKQELQADLGEDPSTSALHKLFCEPAMNDTVWSLLVGNYSFADNIADALLLAQIGTIAKQAEVPFIAAGKETLAGCESLADFPDADDWQYSMKPGAENAWKLLRQDAVAEYLALALPRFLLRAPYGQKSKPIEAFKFEEMPEQPCHECYLWGNAAFIKAEQLARAFASQGWAMQPAQQHQTDNMPMYYYDDDGDMQLMPCAEIYLTEKGGRKFSDSGLITLWSVKNMDAVRSSDFNSMAAAGHVLPGRWV